MPTANLETEDINAQFHTTEGLRGPKGYRDLKMVNEYLESLAQKYPKIVKVEQYGVTESGLPLFLLKVSDNVENSEQEPKLIIDAGTHGDEAIGVEVLLRAIDDLLSKYGIEARETKIIDSLELSFVPVVNPEGYSRFERYSRGVDPNRDYPWPEKPDKKSVACISSLRELFERNSYVGSLTLHAYGKLVMFPWAYTAEPISDYAKRSEMEQLAAQMAEPNGYVHGPIATTIYVAKGSSSDYYYWKHNTAAIAMELGNSKAPPEAEIPKYLTQVRESIWRFMEHFK
jgi:murein tripeptide amidase MpaA